MKVFKDNVDIGPFYLQALPLRFDLKRLKMFPIPNISPIFACIRKFVPARFPDSQRVTFRKRARKSKSFPIFYPSARRGENIWIDFCFKMPISFYLHEIVFLYLPPNIKLAAGWMKWKGQFWATNFEHSEFLSLAISLTLCLDRGFQIDLDWSCSLLMEVNAYGS